MTTAQYVLVKKAQMETLALLTRGGVLGNIIIEQKTDDIEITWASLDGTLEHRLVKPDGKIVRKP